MRRMLLISLCLGLLFSLPVTTGVALYCIAMHQWLWAALFGSHAVVTSMFLPRTTDHAVALIRRRPSILR